MESAPSSGSNKLARCAVITLLILFVAGGAVFSGLSSFSGLTPQQQQFKITKNSDKKVFAAQLPFISKSINVNDDDSSRKQSNSSPKKSSQQEQESQLPTTATAPPAPSTFATTKIISPPTTLFDEAGTCPSSTGLCTPCTRDGFFPQTQPSLTTSSNSTTTSPLSIFDLTKLFSTETTPWDKTTSRLIENFKRSVVDDPVASAAFLQYGHNFLPPCNLHNPTKLNLATFSKNALMNEMSMFDLLRLYRNATVNELFELENTPVICLLSLLHTKNCRAEEESFQGCILRLGVESAEGLVPDLCAQRGFWKNFKEQILVPAEKKYLEQIIEKNQKSVDSDVAVKNEQKLQQLIEERRQGWKNLKRGVIPHSTCKSTPDEIQEYIPPEDRFPTNYGEPLLCLKNNLVIHQIGFAVPRATVVDKISRTKAFDFMPVMPGPHLGDRGYKVGLHQEAILRELYANSYFSFTNSRGGVDCMRHLEILGSGSVPYFPEIETVAKHSVGYLPKELLKKVLTLPGLEHIGPVPDRYELNQRKHEFYEPIHQHHIHFKKRGWIDVSKFDVAEYYRIADALLEYTKKYLTCGSMVASILKRMGERAENATNVLVVSRFTYDYLHQNIHVGLSELGIAFTVVGEDSKRWSYRLNDCSPLNNMTEVKRGEVLQRLPYLYGNGLGVPVRAFNGDHNIKYVHDKHSDRDLIKNIKRRAFDAVIYSYIYGGMSSDAPYLSLVKKFYSKNEVAFLDHEDAHFTGTYEYSRLSNFGTVFARELDERRSCR